MRSLFRLQTLPAPSCSFCGTTSGWSAESVDRIELGEPYECPECDESSPAWEGDRGHELDGGESMAWAQPDSPY